MARCARPWPEAPISMSDDLASANVNRSYSLAATSITVFTFLLAVLYPRYAAGEVDATLFQISLIAMAVATFSFVMASFHYYGSSLGPRVDDAHRQRFARRGDRLWLLGYTILFLVPSLILFTLRLNLVGGAWIVLWLVCVAMVIRYFPLVQTPPKP
jgi:hypothetical protein